MGEVRPVEFRRRRAPEQRFDPRLSALQGALRRPRQGRREQKRALIVAVTEQAVADRRGRQQARGEQGRPGGEASAGLARPGAQQGGDGRGGVAQAVQHRVREATQVRLRGAAQREQQDRLVQAVQAELRGGEARARGLRLLVGICLRQRQRVRVGGVVEREEQRAPPLRAAGGRLRRPAVVGGQAAEPVRRQQPPLPVPPAPLLQPARVRLRRAQQRVRRVALEAVAQALDQVPRRGEPRCHVRPVPRAILAKVSRTVGLSTKPR